MEYRGRSYSRGAEEKHKPTTRMNDETWEKFKPYLCHLYKNYTLSVVMNIMERRHRIVQSKRQYGYRFEKWGVKKYNASEKKASPSALSAIDNESMDFGDAFADLDRDSRCFNQQSLLGLPDEDTFVITTGLDGMDYDSPFGFQGRLIQYPWGTGSDEEAKKLAADFCAAMLDDTNAFDLYSDLYKSLSKSQQSLPATSKLIATCCARVAGRPDNARSAREILSNEWPQAMMEDNSESPFV
ncbi:hypothetical protein F66182_12241, partial [Fusarium sp. NRRL 66182]